MNGSLPGKSRAFLSGWPRGLAISTALTVVICVYLILSQNDQPLLAFGSGPTPWSTPAALTPEQVWGRAADIAADPSGHLHAIWSGTDPSVTQFVETETPLLMYAYFDGARWSEPVDIVSQRPTLYYSRIVADSKGGVHLFWSGDCLYYQHSLDPEPTSAALWSSPAQCLTDRPLVTRFGAAADAAGALYLALPTAEGTIVSLRSPDLGASWGPPVTIAGDFAAPARFASNVDLAVDRTGRIHVVWLEVSPTGYPAYGLYYSASADQGKTWSAKALLDADRPAEARLIVDDMRDLIHVIWNADASVGARRHRLSRDSGRTWLPTDTILKQAGGYQGPPAAALDSAGTLYAFFTGDKGLFYVSWNGETRSEPEALFPDILNREQAFPAAAVTEGNRLHVVWGLGEMRYIWRTTEAPYMAPSTSSARTKANAPKSLATTVAATTPRQSASRATPPLVASTPAPPLHQSIPNATLQASAMPPMHVDDASKAWWPIALGVLPGAILAVGVVLARLRSRYW